MFGGSKSKSRTDNINDQDQSYLQSRDLGGAVIDVDAGAFSGKNTSLEVTDARNLSDNRSLSIVDHSSDDSISGSFNQDNRKLTAIDGSFNTDNRSYSDSRSFSSIERTTTNNADNRSFVYNDLGIDAMDRSLSTVDLATVAQHETLRSLSKSVFGSLATVSSDARGTTDRIVEMAETFRDSTASQLSAFKWLLIPLAVVMGIMALRGGRAR